MWYPLPSWLCGQGREREFLSNGVCVPFGCGRRAGCEQQCKVGSDYLGR
jgi:hypothetical protein